MSKQILKFSAAWCGPCKTMSVVLGQLTLPVDIHEIDVDENHKLVVQYAIRGVPTLVLVDDNGAELSRLVGSAPAEKIKNWISTHHAVLS